MFIYLNVNLRLPLFLMIFSSLAVIYNGTAVMGATADPYSRTALLHVHKTPHRYPERPKSLKFLETRHMLKDILSNPSLTLSLLPGAILLMMEFWRNDFVSIPCYVWNISEHYLLIWISRNFTRELLFEIIIFKGLVSQF